MLVIVATPAIARQASDRMTAAEEAAVQQALDRGALMYAYDQAAWLGTDDLLAKDKSVASRSGGWIVDGPADAPELTFIDKDADHPHAIYVADFKEGSLVSSHVVAAGRGAELTPEQSRLVAALRTARAAIIAAKPTMCSSAPFNTIVLPPRSPAEPALVYFLTPQTDSKAFPFGGHYLVPVNRDGSVGAIKPFAKSCAVISEEPDKQPAAMVISHLLDPTPTEIHVFESLEAKMPVYVLTTQNQKIWSVEGGRIRLIDQSKK